MSKTISGFLKGMGAGVAVGIAAGITGTIWMNSGKNGVKKKASKAVKTLGDFMEDVYTMIK